MILITKVKLHNVCQHADLEVELNTGFTAIIGPNAAGKSTLLRAIAYGLTGLVDGSWGTQQNMQKDNEPSPGYVELDLNDATDNYMLKRYVTGGVKFPDLLTKNGEQAAIRRATVDKYLAELLGIPMHVLFRLVWGRQEELDWLLRSTSAYINDFLSAVFDMSKLNRLSLALKNIYGQIALNDKDYDSELQDRNTDLEQLKEECKQAEQLFEDSKAAMETAAKALSESAEALKDVQTYDEWVAKLDALKTRALGVNKQLTEVTNKLSELQYPEGIKESDLILLSEELVDGMYNNTLNAISENTKKSNENSLNSVHCRHNLEAAEIRLKEVEDNIKTLRRILEEQPTVCELCGSPIENVDTYRKQLLQTAFCSESVERITIKLEAAKAKSATDQQLYQRKLSELAVIKTQLDKYLTDDQKELKHLSDLLKALKAKSAKTSLMERSAELQNTLSELRKEYKQVKSEVHTEETDDRLIQYQACLETNERATLEYNNTRDSYNRLKCVIEERSEVLKQLTAEADQFDINRSAYNMLTELRCCFGSNRAQAIYVKAKIELLNRHMEQLLRLTDLPFVVYLDVYDHVFRYTTEDGSVHPAGHLSGAQKKMAAMILQLSLMDIVHPNLGLQMFDEVDAALDPGNRILLASLMQRLNSRLSGTVLLVTREQESIEQCANTITLGE